jgi:hypothetical protein
VWLCVDAGLAEGFCSAQEQLHKSNGTSAVRSGLASLLQHSLSKLAPWMHTLWLAVTHLLACCGMHYTAACVAPRLHHALLAGIWACCLTCCEHTGLSLPAAGDAEALHGCAPGDGLLQRQNHVMIAATHAQQAREKNSAQTQFGSEGSDIRSAVAASGATERQRAEAVWKQSLQAGAAGGMETYCCRACRRTQQ